MIMRFIRSTIYFFALLLFFSLAHSASAANVFYSVGQNQNDNKQASTVTITAGAAVFSAAQTGNIGVGDRVTYNSHNITSAFADGTGGYTTVTSTSHGFQNGDYISITGTTNYNGTWAVSSVATNTFKIHKTYVAEVAHGKAANIAYIAAKTNDDMAHWTLVNVIGGTPNNATTKTVFSITREYTSLQSAITSSSDANHISNASLVAATVVLNIPCYYDSGADTSAVTVASYTTSATYYIRIYTPYNNSTEINWSQRHNGKWSIGKYQLGDGTVHSDMLLVQVPYTRIDGLQIYASNYGSDRCINMDTGAIQGQISNNILKGSPSGASNLRLAADTSGSTGQQEVWNNIIYNSTTYGIFSDDTGYIYNNTIYGCDTGIDDEAYNNGNHYGVVAKNNIVQSTVTAGYTGAASPAFDPASTTNISDHADAPRSNPQNSKTVAFADLPNKDYHLSLTDAVAKDTGADLHADGSLPFSTDIDTAPRPNGAWDIGADEAATQVYYSVGQNQNNLMTGSPTITIANGIATFNAAQTSINMGVGDGVLYNPSTISAFGNQGGGLVRITTSAAHNLQNNDFVWIEQTTNYNGAYKIAYVDTTHFDIVHAYTAEAGGGARVVYNLNAISGKTDADQKHWSLVDQYGAKPNDVGSARNVSYIVHPFDSLNAAVTSISGHDYLNTSDLVAGNYQLNITCYYDTGPDDTDVVVNGWNTGAGNYIRIYTPQNTATEANNSQRHSGKWDSSKYSLEINDDGPPLSILSSFVTVDGLQIASTTEVKDYSWGIHVGDNNSLVTGVTVKNNLVKAGYAGGQYDAGIRQDSNGVGPNYYYNNIVYGFTGTNNACISIDSDFNRYFTEAYNNTVYNCGTGYAGEGATYINNIAQNTSYAGFDVWTNTPSLNDYNISDHAYNVGNGTDNSDEMGTHGKTAVTVAFVNTGSQDFHLAAADTAAKDAGSNLSADQYLAFATDIDLQSRPFGSAWDIGADETQGSGMTATTNVSGLSTTTVNASQNSKMTTGLVGEWSFDGPDISGTTATDRSVSGNNGTITGATPAIGKIGQALNFANNTTDNVSFNDSAAWTWTPVTQDRTLAFWYYPTALPTDSTHPFQFLISSSAPGNHYQFVHTYNNVLACAISDNSWSPLGAFSANWTATLNTWYHIVFVASSAGNNKIYINGIPQTVTDGNWTQNTSINPTVICTRDCNGSVSGSGRLDELRWYSRALSAQEVNDLYNLGQATMMGN